MKSITKVFPYITAFVLIFSLIVSALAGEMTISFSDVPTNSPYYDAITYFAGKGIVSGQKDGKFHPEAEMSTREWADILSSVGADPAQFASGNATADPAGLYASIWRAAKIKTYPASEYGYISALDAGTTAMIVTGMIQEEDIARKSVSRGEALRLIYEIAVEKSIKEVSPNLVNFFNITIGEGCSAESENLVRTLLAEYPNNQLALLLAYRYQFIVLTDLGLAPNGHSEQLGFEDIGEHIIYLNESGISQALLHEVGHAIETCHSSYSRTWKLNKAEGSAGAKFLGVYAGVNANEFIAEATRYYIENKNDDTALEKMSAAIPQTYEHIVSVMNEDSFLTEEYFMTAVFAG